MLFVEDFGEEERIRSSCGDRKGRKKGLGVALSLGLSLHVFVCFNDIDYTALAFSLPKYAITIALSFKPLTTILCSSPGNRSSCFASGKVKM